MKKYIEGYEGIYQIDESGTIYRKDGFILNVGTCNGYKRVWLNDGNSRKKHLLHVLVSKAFIDNPYSYPCVNHKDGNKLNNEISNLEWCTYRQNTAHWHNEIKQSNNLPVGVEQLPSGNFRTRIRINGKYINLGIHPNKWRAGTIYLQKEKALREHA